MGGFANTMWQYFVIAQEASSTSPYCNSRASPIRRFYSWASVNIVGSHVRAIPVVNNGEILGKSTLSDATDDIMRALTVTPSKVYRPPDQVDVASNATHADGRSHLRIAIWYLSYTNFEATMSKSISPLKDV